MRSVKRAARERKPAAARLQKSQPAKPSTRKPRYFDVDTFASENDRRLCKKINDYGRRLGRLEKPKPGRIEHYWQHRDEIIAVIGAHFWPIKDATSEAQARRIARKLEKMVDAMIAEWKRTERAAIADAIRAIEMAEAERQEEIEHDRALAIQLWPQLADEDFLILGGRWVICGVELGEPRRPGPRSTFNSFFRRR